jgi:hypothetical protein
MGWKFWEQEKTNDGEVRLPGPKSIPDAVGRYLVTDEKKDPDWVWNLKGVVRPTERKNVFYCRILDEAKATEARVKVKDWNSLDEHPDLILWEGCFNKETWEVRREKFVKPSE